MTKKRSAKNTRVPLKERLEGARRDGRIAGFEAGLEEGRAAGRREFLPAFEHRDALDDFAKLVESWPVSDGAVVAIVATDLKSICNAAVPARTMRMIVSEIRRRQVLWRP